MTESVPLEVSEDVAVRLPPVIVPPVKEVINPVTALREVVKKLEDVALVSVAFVAVKLVITEVTALKSVAKRLEEEALTFRRLVISACVLKSRAIVPVEA